jgi:hypothetical protein
MNLAGLTLTLRRHGVDTRPGSSYDGRKVNKPDNVTTSRFTNSAFTSQPPGIEGRTHHA